MINQEIWMEVQILWKQGRSIRSIAKTLGMCRNTVRKILKADKKTPPSYGPRKKSASILDAYKEYIAKRVNQASPHNIPATVLLREIQELGYKGKLTLVRNFLRRLSIKPDEEKIIRFETPPGMQAQVDWTTMQRGKLYAFIMILGFSRFAYVEFVEKTDLKQLLVCHENAFEFFGGTCRDLLYDNMKTVVIERDRYGSGKHGFQQAFWDFSKHWGFLPRLCRPYRAQTKGKVERFIGYMKRSFYYPLVTKEKDIDLCSLNFEVKKWLLEIAAKRFLKERASTPDSFFPRKISIYCL